MGAASIVSMPDAPMSSRNNIGAMLLRDDIDYLHELADSGSSSGPLDQYRIPSYATDLTGLPQAIVGTVPVIVPQCDARSAATQRSQISRAATRTGPTSLR